MNRARLLLAASACLLLVACSSTDNTGPYTHSPFSEDGESPKTPPGERVADLLREAKQQYDERHYEASFRYAETAEDLIDEHKFDDVDRAMAITIQGYCLLQLGRVQDYFISTHGVQKGALSKFRAVLGLNPDYFRAKLGVALARFRLHGDSIRKAESLDQGMIWIAQISEDARRGLAAPGTDEGRLRLRYALQKHKVLADNRAKMIELGFVFADPETAKFDDKGRRDGAKWLAGMDEGAELKALKDCGYILEDAAAGTKLKEGDPKRLAESLKAIGESWRAARNYWRRTALTDLQAARDGFLEIRKISPTYFWVERDLVYVYQSLGAFFLDLGMEQARLSAIAEGKLDDALEETARRIFVSKGFTSREKDEAKKNYEDALEFTLSFVARHEDFERKGIARRDRDEFDDINDNPFLVDLVQRYRATMDELLAEERGMRATMLLEAASLCIDPVFQLNDHAKAISIAARLKALMPNNPVHHFVKATAYFTGKDYQPALDSYQAFMKESSISEHTFQRGVARQRILECEREIVAGPAKPDSEDSSASR